MIEIIDSRKSRFGQITKGLSAIAERYGYTNKDTLLNHLPLGMVWDYKATPPELVNIKQVYSESPSSYAPVETRIGNRFYSHPVVRVTETCYDSVQEASEKLFVKKNAIYRALRLETSCLESKWRWADD